MYPCVFQPNAILFFYIQSTVSTLTLTITITLNINLTLTLNLNLNLNLTLTLTPTLTLNHSPNPNPNSNPLQMGLRLLTPDGMRIRRVMRFVLRCHACGTVARELSRHFCRQGARI